MASMNLSYEAVDDNGYLQLGTSHVPLCAVGTILKEKAIFSPIHDRVNIAQKVVDYRPEDKLIFAVLGFLCGSRTIFDINHTLRVHQPLLRAFGYFKCADQSVIQSTLNAATAQNVTELELAVTKLYSIHSQSYKWLQEAQADDKVLTFDLDLCGQLCSKNAEAATKGYFAKVQHARGRQLARFLCASNQEITTEALYPGNTTSSEVFKPMTGKLEQALDLDTVEKRRRVRLRIDAGFGTDKNINYALFRGYHLLAKVYSGKRAQKLAKSVQAWSDVPSAADRTPRQAGFVTCPHRYGRKTRQVAIRTPKKKGGYSYSLLVSTDLEADLVTIVTDYDQRCGVPESTFCQDNQGLSNRKRRKRSFIAQQMLMLLNQLAHNLIIWLKQWLIEALMGMPEKTEHTMLAVQTIAERGIQRMMQQILALKGSVLFKGQRVYKITLHPGYPLISRIHLALHALCILYGIHVSWHEIKVR